MSKAEIGEERERKLSMAGTQKDESFWRLEEQGEQPRARKTVTIRPVTAESFSRLEELDEQLLPGLSNDIVLDQIVPRLPWRAFHILSCVHRSWQKAIKSHQVYDARVRLHSTETLIVLNFWHSLSTSMYGVNAICLYSVREKTWHQLPDFPHKRIPRGIPNSCRCVSLEGKIYILGGETEEDCKIDSREVYVLDVAGQTEWRQCGSMLEPRQDFACGVINGKIYVVGGTSCGKTIRRSEVYDPKGNTWSPALPMIWTRSDHHSVTVGGKLFLYGGMFYDRDCDANGAEDDPRSEWNYRTYDWGSHGRPIRRDADFAEVYDPGRDEWELVEPFDLCYGERLFTVQEKLYSMTPDYIYVYDRVEDWRELHSFLFSGVESADSVSFDLFATLAVQGELLALVSCPSFSFSNLGGLLYETLLQSKGFGSEDEKIVWEKVNCSLSDYSGGDGRLGSCSGQPFMCPIQL